MEQEKNEGKNERGLKRRKTGDGMKKRKMERRRNRRKSKTNIKE